MSSWTHALWSFLTFLGVLGINSLTLGPAHLKYLNGQNSSRIASTLGLLNSWAWVSLIGIDRNP